MPQSSNLDESQIIKLPDAELSYHSILFPSSEASSLLKNLQKKIEWTQNRIRFYGKESLVPRLEAWYGNPGKSYAYSGIHMDPKPWTDELLFIKKAIEP